MTSLLSLLLASQAMNQAGVSEFWRFNCSVSDKTISATLRRVDAIYFTPTDKAGFDRFDYRDPTNLLNRPTGWAPAENWLVTANGLPSTLTAWLGANEKRADGVSIKRIDTQFSLALSLTGQQNATLTLTDFRSAPSGRVMQTVYTGDCIIETGAEAFDRYFEVQK